MPKARAIGLRKIIRPKSSRKNAFSFPSLRPDGYKPAKHSFEYRPRKQSSTLRSSANLVACQDTCDGTYNGPQPDQVETYKNLTGFIWRDLNYTEIWQDAVLIAQMTVSGSTPGLSLALSTPSGCATVGLDPLSLMDPNGFALPDGSVLGAFANDGQSADVSVPSYGANVHFDISTNAVDVTPFGDAPVAPVTITRIIVPPGLWIAPPPSGDLYHVLECLGKTLAGAVAIFVMGLIAAAITMLACEGTAGLACAIVSLIMGALWANASSAVVNWAASGCFSPT